MNAPAWLAQQGPDLLGEGELAFAPAQQEAAAALAQTVISPLAHLGAIRASGTEAELFLQGQLSNDLRRLGAAQAQLSSYNSPKGRVLDLLVLRRDSDSILLEARHDTLGATLKRLRMFVLRSKVALEDLGARYAAFGLSGPAAAELLRQAGLPQPAQDWDCADADGVTVMRRPGAGAPRYSVHAAPERLAALWGEFASQSRPVGTAAWRLLDILAGLPAIRPQTADHFVAQMLNLDHLGAISFSKGCYPGQEIVARMHYLGNLKRRMFLCRAGAGEAAPGMPIHAADGDAQAIGEVVDGAPHPEGGSAFLAVLQLGHGADPQIRLGAADGALLPVQIQVLAA